MTVDPHLLNAIRFLTVVPTPHSDTAPAPDWLARAMKYFPLVGIGIGVVSAVVFVISSAIWSPTIAAMLAVTASILLTSAFHEDGLADTFDAFGGGWTVERRLEIMKDSRIGTYGALALGLGTTLRIAALATLTPWIGAAALIAAHAAARVLPALVMNRMSHSGDPATMKVSYVETPVRSAEITFAMITAALALLPLMLMAPRGILVGLLLGAALGILLARWAKRLIGGYTGDVLGAIEQLFEIGFLLGVAAMLR